MDEKRTLKDVLPQEFFLEFAKSPVNKYLDVAVVKEHSLGNQDAWVPWPGTHRNVMNWWELENDKSVGWNENPSTGWNFVVVDTPDWVKRYGRRTLDFSYAKYKNAMLLPSKASFTVIHGYSGGKVLFSKPKAEVSDKFLLDYPASLVKEEELDKEAYLAAMGAYRDEDSRLFGEFKLDLFSEFNVEDNPKRDRAFDIAWSHGHSSGYGDVVSYFEELVDLIAD